MSSSSCGPTTTAMVSYRLFLTSIPPIGNVNLSCITRHIIKHVLFFGLDACFDLISIRRCIFILLVGGTFALYSLICRYAKVSLIPNNQPEDRELSNYKLDIPSNELKRAQNIKKKMENSKMARYILFIVTIMGTSMVIGDGILTPSISGNSLLWPTCT